MGCSQSKPVASTPLGINTPELNPNAPSHQQQLQQARLPKAGGAPEERKQQLARGAKPNIPPSQQAINVAAQQQVRRKSFVQSLEQATTASSVSSTSSKPMSVKHLSTSAPLRANSKVNGASGPKAIMSPPLPPDPRWEEVWGALHPFLLDPADVPAVMAELVSQTINKLSPTEVTFLQRRVRTVVGRLPPREDKSKMMGRVFSTTSAEAESRGIVEKYHLLDEHVFRKVLGGSPLLQPSGATLDRRSADPIAAAYSIMLHLTSESVSSLWDRVAEIAVESAQRAGLEMDVNKGRKFERIPSPPPQLVEEDGTSNTAEVLKLGASVSSFSFLVALALRGTRHQRLQLLFYLLLPPATLTRFLDTHPGGGVPTWLLEVGNECVLSLASMAHYFYFGTTFLPSESLAVAEIYRDQPTLTVMANAVQDILGLLLEKETKMKKKDSESETPPSASDVPNNKSPSPSRSNSVGANVFKRRGSNQNDGTVEPPAVERRRTDVMERLHQIAIGKEVAYDTIALMKSSDKFQKAAATHATEDEDGIPLNWTMAEFVLWADDALDESAMDAIMHRIFVVGILPSPSTERALVLSRWQEWQRTEGLIWSQAAGPLDSLDFVSPSIRKLASLENGEDSTSSTVEFRPPSRVWGGFGGFDGRAGVGFGMMYCIDKEWWKNWEDYVGWSWNGANSFHRHAVARPGDITTETLLDRTSEFTIAGTLGSYELMKQGLRKNLDYVLIPPAVWDVLYEIYGGGPPVPRMVLPPPPYVHRNRSSSADSKQMEEVDIVLDGDHTEVISKNHPVLRLPESFEVCTHPWILHCQLCDALQPYRRGDAGPLSIRVMATPDQPLWRLYAELIVRLPVYNQRASDSNGRGKARLWKRVEGAASKDPMSRYGPWVLLCKNRTAILPLVSHEIELEHNFDELRENWQAFADHTTIEGIGLANGDRIMLEYGVRNKDGEFLWPREAAAKAGRVRRLADEDAKFRQTIRGVDEDGKPLENPPNLVGMPVDAMDASGRWYQVEIIKVETFAVEEQQPEEEQEAEPEPVIESSEGFGNGAVPPPEEAKPAAAPTENKERKQVRVDFTEHGGHPEWIDVDSDRLATAGRFTMGQQDENPAAQSTSTKSLNVNDSKVKSVNPLKKNGNNDPSTGDLSGGKVCTFPGFGACGLSNLGNTCYANSAIQCISYLPLLRAYLLSAQYKATGDLNKDNPLGTSGKLLEETAELLRVMWSAKVGEKSPSRFRNQLAKVNTQFSGADQQDAQEFLNFMLDVLHEDANRVKKKPYVEALEDEWVTKIDLWRVGVEAWRRFLRRNRSIVADVAMGQVLSTVTCPACGFSSRNFDPFNLLSIPFPTVADVIFRCTVVRRANAYNAPWVLGKSRKLDRKRERFGQSDPTPVVSSTPTYLVEEYVVAMSRLADIDDLKLRLQNVCGISATRLRLTRGEEVTVLKDQDETSPVKHHIKMTPLLDKEGPCIQLTKKDASAASDEVGTPPKEPTHILAFEVTLSARPKPKVAETEVAVGEGSEPPPEEDEETADEEEDDDENDDEKNEECALSQKELRALEDRLKVYGDDLECRVFDTDPLLISKAISRSLWPRTEDELKLGLRVDAIDHRDHWFPGSVVEIVEGVDNGVDENATKTKVRIHFDNFSSKWDEMYTIDHFTKGQVKPLYAHASPRLKPTEFIVHHRFTDRASKAASLFGQPFYLQCKNEWSTARAGAHILGQTSRFLQRKSEASVGPVDVDEVQESETKAQRLYEKTQGAISELIDLLIDCDREYVRSALGLSRRQMETEDVQPYRNPKFDATTLSTALVKKVSALLHRLPFEVRVCTADAPLGGKSSAGNDEVPFPFSLMRTIGNYMNARHAIVLHWREPPMDKRTNSKYSNYLNAPVMYVQPSVVIDSASAALLDQNDPKKSKNSPGGGGLHLGVCLTEFCKVQQLPLSDNWKCPRCKEFREGEQSLTLWRLPDLLTFHIKRFNCSARWREKITTKVNFPLTGLDMREWCHNESPAMQFGTEDSNVYDLIGVINHYGGMTGGHYVATCKATACGRDGSEEVAYNFSGSCVPGCVEFDDESDAVAQGGWRLGRPKVEVNQNRLAANATARSATESAEPLWLQFDDDLVEPIPPRNVVSELAYVLFYRRRRMTPANIAKYSTLE